MGRIVIACRMPWGLAAVLLLMLPALAWSQAGVSFPPAVFEIQPLVIGEGEGVAWAVPIGKGRYLCAAHTTEHGRPLRVPAGEARNVQRLEGDLAMFEAASAAAVLRIAKSVPEVGETVTYRTYMPDGAVPTVARGWVLGVNGSGMLEVDGMGSQGASGSGVLNSKGELVGVVSRGQNPAAVLEPQRPQSVAEKLDLLATRSHTRAVLVVTVVVGRTLGEHNDEPRVVTPPMVPVLSMSSHGRGAAASAPTPAESRHHR